MHIIKLFPFTEIVILTEKLAENNIIIESR